MKQESIEDWLKNNKITMCPTVALVKSSHLNLKLSKLERDRLAEHRKKVIPIKEVLGKSFY